MNAAVILAGGTGTRAGLDIPKQYYEVNGKLVISYCLYTFLTHEKIDAVQITADGMWRDYIRRLLSDLPCNEKFRGRTGSFPYLMRLLTCVSMRQKMTRLSFMMRRVRA